MLRVASSRCTVALLPAGRLAQRHAAPSGRSSATTSAAAWTRGEQTSHSGQRINHPQTARGIASTPSSLTAAPSAPKSVPTAAAAASSASPSTTAAASESGAPFTADSTPSSSSPPPASSSTSGYFTRQLNTALSLYPLESILSLALLEGVSFTLTKTMFHVMDVQFSTLFAVAFVLSMPLRRSMLPKLSLAFPLTLILHKLFPSWKDVHLTHVWTRRKEWAPKWMHPKEKKQVMVDASASKSAEPVISTPARIILALQSILPAAIRGRPYQPLQPTLMQRMGSLSDKYGLALLISYRLAGCVLVNGVYMMLLKGIDVTPLLHWFGYTGDVSQVSSIGSYAGAVVFASVWFPLTVFLAPYPAKLMWIGRRAIFGKRELQQNGEATNTGAEAVQRVGDGTAKEASSTAASTPSSSTKSSSALLLAVFVASAGLGY